MNDVRISSEREWNDRLQEAPDAPSNTAWFKQRGVGQAALQVLLIGAADLTGFRSRSAQAILRGDLRPSRWSEVALVVRGPEPLLWRAGIEPFDLSLSQRPEVNGIEGVAIEVYDDVKRYPNIALLNFPLPGDEPGPEKVMAIIERLQRGRGESDLVTPGARWQSYIVGAQNVGNPLRDGTPTPCAMFVDMVFGALDIDISPGVGARALSPEAIWNAAVWWKGNYGGDLSGEYLIRQPDASPSHSVTPTCSLPARKNSPV